MRLLPRAYALLFAATLLATSGCFCCRPWHHCHRCCYAGPDDRSSPPRDEALLVTPAVAAATPPGCPGR